MLSDNYPKAYLYRRIVLSKIFMDNNYSKRIDLEDIADEAFFSKFHFIRLFKKIYGLTPHQYLRHVRIKHAGRLLKKGLPVSEVCYSVGFESLSSFSGLFSRLIGKSPLEYQLHYQKLESRIQNAPLEFIPGCFAEKRNFTGKSNFEEIPY